jgi:lysophospholipase L1-like esterase
VVDYPKPTTAGGTSPLTVACAPPQGTAFPVGTSTVTCTVQDAQQRSAACSFPVTVSRPPRLRLSKFLAFGDSITAGVLFTACPIGGGVSCAAPTLAFSPGRFSDFSGMRLAGEATPAAYPRAVHGLLTSRYTTQSFVVDNEGNPGEPAADGKSRLPDVLAQRSPEVLLLLQGTVDASQGGPSANAIVEDLRTMIRSARGRGIEVFAGTLTPQRPNACRGYDFCDGVNDVIRTNALIRTMVPAEGATLVELYLPFEGQLTTWLGQDGLHPNETGYAKIAELFYGAIGARLEVP